MHGIVRSLALGVFTLAWVAGSTGNVWSMAGTGLEMRRAVEGDWDRQEERLGRPLGSVESLNAAIERAEAWLARNPGGSRSRVIQSNWATLREDAKRALDGDCSRRLDAYRRVRWQIRAWVLEESGITGQPVIFLKRNRFICQMLHEYMGYFHDYGDVPGGGGVYVLEQPGASMACRDLLQERLTGGNFTTLALSYDGQELYFAFAARSDQKPRFHSADRRSFQLFGLRLAGGELRQLTAGVEDSFDPCPLPDGGLAFMSTRRGGFARCNNAWEPCATYTLHRMEADGTGVRALSVHETSEWHPSVMNDGRLMYIRWDYVDRSAANFHGIWTSNPDGTGVASLFGNYTMRINACYQPRAIPGSEKLLFVAGAHHADVGGAMVMLDPRRVGYDLETGEDRMDAIELLTPELCFPESEGWPRSYFHSPWPLSEDRMLVSFSFEPLPGMSSGEGRDTRTGLYYWDRWGNMELLYRDTGISSMYPIPLRPRPCPPAIASTTHHSLDQEGEFLLADVRRSFFPLPADRGIKELRVFQLLPKAAPHTANEPRIGHANAENARLLLGTVPVEGDGSAYFRVPAGRPVYFQAVDGEGRAVQSMRSAVYVQPGERRSCVGCHERPGSSVPGRSLMALRRAASTLTPGPEGSNPMSYVKLVQGVLDRHCVECHDGREGAERSALVLTGEPTAKFSRSYENLRPYLRWYEWGAESISQITTIPGQVGADASPLTRVLADSRHQAALKWSDAERRQLFLWMDTNAPFFGTYSAEEQYAQREGREIPSPLLQ